MNNSRQTTAKVSIVWLYVKDPEKSIQFYRDVLGFELVQSSHEVWGLLNAGTILLGVHREIINRKSQPGGILVVLETRNIRNTFKKLQEEGVRFLAPIRQEDVGEMATFNDPDGNLLELWQPSPT